MKSALEEVVCLYDSLFEDLSNMHPSIKVELQRDLSRLHSGASNSGLPFFTITLPEMTKYLRKSLEIGFLDPVRPPFLGMKSRQDARPRFFYGLWSNIFEADGTLRLDRDISSIQSLTQIFHLAKKLNMKCEQRYVEMAIADFREIEESLPRSWDDTWDHDDPIWCRRDGHPIWGAIAVDDRQTSLFDDSNPLLRTGVDPDWSGFRNFVARLSSQLGDLHPFEVKPKHGPGAIADKSPYTKYDGRYWTSRLEKVFPYDWFGAPSPEYLDYVDFREFPSRLIAVPKTQSGPRLIAAEPTAHQWIQGGLQRWLERAIKDTILVNCIDFRSQVKSQDLALDSSRSKSHATIDLKSASDRLTTRLVEYCFQGNRSLLDALHASRTRCVEVQPGELILLRKFSTQGSACTFPVQTMVFSMLAIWAVALVEGRKDWESLSDFSKQVRVFGDDIIVPNNAYEVLTSLLTTCLLKVNTSKSFSQGEFRESCGMDAYAGVDITPAYFRQLPDTAATSLESIVECSNNFFKKGYWHTADRILKTVSHKEIKNLLVKSLDSGAFGLISFCGTSVAHLRMRFNEYLQRNEVKTLAVSTKAVRVRGRGHGDLLQFFVEEPDPLLPYQGGEVSGVKSRKTLTWVDLSQVNG